MMDSASIISKNGLKCTKHRVDVLDVLINASSPMTADMIFSQLSGISRSTVYRILEKLEEKEIVSKQTFSGCNEVYFEFALNKHKHYAVCLECHEMHEIEICPVHDAKVDNFTVTGHRVELYGYCDKCRNKEELPVG